MTAYTYISSVEFINNLKFNYIETYSFQRGNEFEEKIKENQIEYQKLDTRKNKSDNLTAEEEKRFIELLSFGSTQYLVDDNGQFHLSSKKINTFNANDPIIDKLKNILVNEVIEVPMWLCSPIYRDAIVFYNKKREIVSVLNVCLSCQYMETKKFNYVNTDYKTYDLLKAFFIDIGHEVENPITFL